jgi:4-diphosphocytidyl-2-C-methyl-D-erythritol kinase
VDLAESWYVVIFPGVTVPTAELFADPELTRDARPIKIRDYFAGGTLNVFEPIVRRRYPAVNLACEWLSNQATQALSSPMMTGTGSCVFAAFANHQLAADIASRALQELPSDWRVICAKACNESPLARKLESVKTI